MLRETFISPVTNLPVYVNICQDCGREWECSKPEYPYTCEECESMEEDFDNHPGSLPDEP